MNVLKITLIALFVSTFSIAQTKDVPAPTAPAKEMGLKFDKEVHDFGNIEKGKPVTYEFTFTNTSKETILITNVRPSCGCTAANYTKTPLKPGEKGYVAATFNAASDGAFHKTITVTTNDTTAAKTLTIKGKVEPAPAATTPVNNDVKS